MIGSSYVHLVSILSFSTKDTPSASARHRSSGATRKIFCFPHHCLLVLQALDGLLDAGEASDAKVLRGKQSFLAGPAQVAVLVPELHHDAELLGPAGPEAVEGVARDLDVDGLVTVLGGPVLQVLARAGLLAVGDDVPAARLLGLLDDGLEDEGEVLADVTDGEDGDVGGRALQLNVALAGGDEVGAVHGEVQVGGVESHPQESGLGVQGLVRLDVLVYLDLALEVRDEVLAAADLLAAGQRGPDEVLQGRRGGGGLGEVDALGDLDLQSLVRVQVEPVEWLEEVGHGEDGVGALEGSDERRHAVGVGGDDLSSLGSQGLAGLALWVAGDGADRVVGILEEDIDDATTLGTGGADDGDELRRHVSSLRSRLIQRKPARLRSASKGNQLRETESRKNTATDYVLNGSLC